MRSQSAGPSAGSSPFLSPKTQGAVFALLATAVWSANFVVSRGMADAVPPCTLAVGRWLTAFCAVLPFSLPALKREWPHFLEHWKYYLAVSLIGTSFFNTVIYIGAHSVPALNMSLIATSSPLFTIILARVLFGEAITRLRLAGIAIALAGILLLMAKGDLGRLASLSFGTGDLLLLSAAMGFSVYTLLLRKRPAGSSQSAFFAVTFGVGLLPLLPLSFWELGQAGPFHFTMGIAGAFLYMGLGASLFSFWCWTRAISAIGPAKAAVIYYSMPLFAGLQAVIFLGEPVRWFHLASSALILGGLFLATKE